LSLGRKSIQKTLKNLKRNVVMDVSSWIKLTEINIEFISKPKTKEEDARLDNTIYQYTDAGLKMLRSFSDYVDALENYVSELDQTFDALLQEARKEAKEEAEKQPKVPKNFYRI